MSMNASRLGAAMYAAANALPAGATAADVQAMYTNIAQAVVNEIKNYATIAALPGTHGSIIGTSPHVHPSITTTAATGKIS